MPLTKKTAAVLRKKVEAALIIDAHCKLSLSAVLS